MAVPEAVLAWRSSLLESVYTKALREGRRLVKRSARSPLISCSRALLLGIEHCSYRKVDALGVYHSDEPYQNPDPKYNRSGEWV